ncbi:MAG: hypothetical protein ACI841_005055 [Planctomycetota bacterium]|jgi:hypothetical protein
MRRISATRTGARELEECRSEGGNGKRGPLVLVRLISPGYTGRSRAARGEEQARDKGGCNILAYLAGWGMYSALMATASRWQSCATADGSFTLLQTSLGQACHSEAGAWTESVERYARATRLREVASRIVAADGAARPLRLLDVGTGVGWNIAAAALELESAPIELEVLSLESDRSVLEVALELPASGPSQADDARRSWLRAGLDSIASGESQAVDWGAGCAGRIELRLGDATQTLRDEASTRLFDAVFLDPFSPAVDPPLWGADFLRQVALCMAPGSWLSTYTASLSVRARLKAAGLRVGPGPRVGDKAQGTLASPDMDPGAFDARTERKLARRVTAELQTGNGGAESHAS